MLLREVLPVILCLQLFVGLLCLVSGLYVCGWLQCASHAVCVCACV